MLRALAALPIDLPAEEAATPFQPVAVEDIAATIAWLAARDIDETATRQRRDMGPDAAAAGHARRRHRTIPPVVRHGRAGRASRCRRFMLDLGAKIGDLAS